MIIVFFKKKTAYEMRISDWSSDVCSSDLAGRQQSQAGESHRAPSDTVSQWAQDQATPRHACDADREQGAQHGLARSPFGTDARHRKRHGDEVVTIDRKPRAA